jgi:thiamine-phosphate pyrophosphorylase
MLPFRKFPTVYPIIDDSICPFDRIEETARAIVKGGARILQLRSKHLPSDRFLVAAKIVRTATNEAGAVFIVNDRVDIAMLSNADGVHLGQEDLPVEEARIILGKESIIGVSTHNISQAVDAQAAPVDYIAFGPIFQTGTKRGAERSVGLQGLSEVRAKIKKPIIAIGGIQETNARDVLEAGADSVAMISEILCSANVRSKMRSLIHSY